ncbi:MAG: UvrD-helicase domain-containing protein [Bacillus sp. (in: firmicutes)]
MISLNQKEDFFERKKRQIGVHLNEVQKKAVLHTEGPFLLLATPGSGKTTTTIMRIGYLIEEKRVHPSRIKAVTFSKAAASDMKERFKRFFPDHPDNSVDFSTIHSLSLQVVRDYFYSKGISYQLIEGKADQNSSSPPVQKKQILRKIFKSVNHESVSEDQLEELTNYISFIKNKLLPKRNWSSVKCDVPNAEQILTDYEKYKRADQNKLLVDFDDMLTIANAVFAKDAALLRKYQQKYDYILTDESQDSSMVQHAIIEKLVQQHQNLYVVADDDQSIYGWRAAEPQYLLQFKKVYPHAVILMMEKNYRSSKEIVETANQFIKQNKNRYDKNMHTENPPNKPIVIKCFEDYKFQAKYLAQEINKLQNYQDAAILFRNKSSAIIIINEFDRAGIPFYMKDHENRFFSHWVVKDILNFMRFSFNDRRLDIFAEISRKLTLYISKDQVDSMKKWQPQDSVFDVLLKHMKWNNSQASILKEYKTIFQKMKGTSPLEAIRTIRFQLGYEETLIKIAKKLGYNKEYLLGILFTLEEMADSLETMEEFAARLKHLETVLERSRFNKNKNAVTLSTLHSSKGLEFKRVYMVDLINGVIPSAEDIEEFENGSAQLLEEAVRLFYVGMTRAEHSLELLSYNKQYGSRVMPSKFVGNVKNIINPPVKVIKKKPQGSKNNPQSTALLHYSKEIETFIQKENIPIFLASKVCQYLIENCHAPNDKYVTGKYKIYPSVVQALESLIKQGYLEFAGEKGRQDRYYKNVFYANSVTKKEDAIIQISLFDQE